MGREEGDRGRGIEGGGGIREERGRRGGERIERGRGEGAEGRE